MDNLQTVRRLTEETLKITAPEEALYARYYEPEKLRPGAAASGPQGFGASGVLAMSLPFVYAFFTKYVEALGSEMGKKTYSAVFDWLSDKQEKRQVAAKSEIAQLLESEGLPQEQIAKTVDAVLLILGR